MDFQQILATFIGALSGFVFSIALFYLTEKWKNSRKNKELGNNLQKELQYGIDFLEAYKKEFEKCVRLITANDLKVYMFFKHEKFPRLFIQEAFSNGLLYGHLNANDISNIDNMLTYFTLPTTNLLTDKLVDFRAEKLEAKDALGVFEYDIIEIEKYIQIIKNVKEKLEKLK